jgi:hypothetical protein
MYQSRQIFFIKKDSTLPKLKFPLTQAIMEYYDITEDMLENCAVTFSMTDADTGIYRIANSEANLEIKEDRPSNPDEVKYTLTYCFSLKDTKKEGHFYGEFKIDFLGENCGKITLPTTQRIDIYIQDSITVTTVV